MLSEDYLLYLTSRNNRSFNKTNEGPTNTFFNSNKLYEINDDYCDINDKNSRLSLNSLKKYKTFKEYKESLEKKITSSNQSNNERKNDFYNEKFGNNKISEFSFSNSNRKFENLDKKYIISRKKLLQDLQSPKEKSTIDKHKSFQKLHISNYGYPNIKKISRSNNISVPSLKVAFTEQKKLNNAYNNSNNINSHKKEEFSLDQRIENFDKNENNNMLKRFEKITNNSFKKDSLSLSNSNKLEKVKTQNIIGSYNINSSKINIKNNTTLNPEEATKTKRGKIILYENEKNLNKIDIYDKLNTKNNIDEEENKIMLENDENDEEEIIISKFLNKKKSNDIKSSNINTEELFSNKMKKKYDEINMEKKEDINELNNLEENSNSTTNFSKNLMEKTKQIKEKRKYEKMKVIEKLNKMKKAQEERYQIIEKELLILYLKFFEASEWKKTVLDIEKSMDSLKNIINDTDGIFSNLFKKGKELEIEVNTIKKMKNKDCDKTYYDNIDNEDIENFKADEEDLTLHGENFIFPIVDDNNLISIL